MRACNAIGTLVLFAFSMNLWRAINFLKANQKFFKRFHVIFIALLLSYFTTKSITKRLNICHDKNSFACSCTEANFTLLAVDFRVSKFIKYEYY